MSQNWNFVFKKKIKLTFPFYSSCDVETIDIFVLSRLCLQKKEFLSRNLSKHNRQQN